MQFLLSLLFILAALSSSNARSVSDILSIKKGGRTIMLPPSVGVDVEHVRGDMMTSWKEVGSSASAIVNGPTDIVYTNDIDQIIPLTRTIYETVYDFSSYTEGDQSPYGEVELISGPYCQLTNGRLRHKIPVPDLRVGQNTNFYTGNWYSSFQQLLAMNAHAGAHYLITKDLPAGDFGMLTNDHAHSDRYYFDAEVGFRGGWTNTYRVRREPFYGVRGDYTYHTNSLRGLLGGRNDEDPYYLLFADPNFSVTGDVWHGPNLELTNGINGVATKASEFGGLSVWFTNLCNEASTNMMTFGPGAQFAYSTNSSSGRTFKMLVIDPTIDSGSKITIHIPEGFLPDPTGQYILNLYHVSDSFSGYPDPLGGSDLCYRYKIDGTYKYHENATGAEHYITLGPNTNAFDITLEFYSGPFGYQTKRRAWSRFSIFKIPDELEVYSTLDLAGTNFVRNTSCWTYGLDMTPFSPWNSHPEASGGLWTRRPVTAIGRDVVLMVNHYYPSNESPEVVFVGPNNEIVKRTIVTTSRVINDESNEHYSEYYETDLRIGILDEPLPDYISHCKVLPEDYKTYLPGGIKTIPVLAIDKFEQVMLGFGAVRGRINDNLYDEMPHASNVDFSNDREWAEDTPLGYHELRMFPKTPDYGYTYNSDYPYLFWDKSSGSPTFFYIENQPVLVTLLSAVVQGESIPDLIPAINATILSAGSTNLLDQIDLSNYWPQ